jgi:tetratricopeptide (TPR) repeat protein
MPSDLIPSGLSAQSAASDELKTDFAPPFRALLGTPAVVPSADPAALPCAGAGQANDEHLPTVPGYEIVGELARGGMGVVYQARHHCLKRQVALKMILAGLHANATARLRFRTEAEAVARLQHPNIVQIFEVGECAGSPFLSLEYIDGGNLLQLTEGTAQPERSAAQLVETLARAVHHTHQRGILHRDLKPTNILLQRQSADYTDSTDKNEGTSLPVQSAESAKSVDDFIPKIADFGLAKLLDADLSPTRSETVLGTPNYMAPEQAAGDTSKVGAAADVYSLGAMLYELLTGRPPFRGATPLSVLEQVRGQEPVPPRSLRPSLSRDLDTICLKCLAKEPGRRYPSAEALADDLHCFLEGRPIEARPVPAWKRWWRTVRRRPVAVAWGIVAAALVGLLAMAWSYFQTADQLGRHRAEEKYREFLHCRDEALLYGLLAPEEGALFLGAEADGNLERAASAARKALALAGVDVETAKAIDPDFPAPRKSEVIADCYALLLVLAGVRGQASRERERPENAAQRCQEALRLLERARQLGPETRAYHLRRAHFLQRLGEQKEATRARERAASLPLEGALDHFLLGEEQYRRGDWGQATDSFNRALGLQPGHFWAQFFLAVCHLKGQHWEAAKAGLNACLAQQPDFVWAYLFRSVANDRLHALPQAEADFQKALQLNPNEDARYVLLLTRGILRFNQKELERAAADFRSARALKPNQYNAYLNLAHVHLARGHFEEAAEQVKAALRLRPPIRVVIGYHVERGRNLLREKRYEEALRACEAALELSPQQTLPCEIRGRALLALGRYRQAETSFDEYLRKGGEQTSDLFRGRGLARMKLGKYPEAIEDYTRALEQAADGEIYQHRGWAHFFSDAWKLALRDFSRALDLDPEAGDAYTGRGLARVMLGHYRDAVADAEAALARKPATPEMMHNLACIFAQSAACAEADLPEKHRKSLADGYRGRALQAVHQALAMVPPEQRCSFWQDRVLPDSALAPIRSEAEFKRLQEKYDRRHE